jgi:hypothetical protein
MAEVVFAVLRCGDIVPGEIDAAAGACFADRREEVHGVRVITLFLKSNIFGYLKEVL